MSAKLKLKSSYTGLKTNYDLNFDLYRQIEKEEIVVSDNRATNTT